LAARWILENQSLLINIVSGAVSIAACFVTIAVIDKVGRSPCY
jgi:SP family sugar:H+ symporter-like MFS transporter